MEFEERISSSDKSYYVNTITDETQEETQEEIPWETKTKRKNRK